MWQLRQAMPGCTKIATLFGHTSSFDRNHCCVSIWRFEPQKKTCLACAPGQGRIHFMEFVNDGGSQFTTPDSSMTELGGRVDGIAWQNMSDICSSSELTKGQVYQKNASIFQDSEIVRSVFWPFSHGKTRCAPGKEISPAAELTMQTLPPRPSLAMTCAAAVASEVMARKKHHVSGFWKQKPNSKVFKKNGGKSDCSISFLNRSFSLVTPSYLKEKPLQNEKKLYIYSKIFEQSATPAHLQNKIKIVSCFVINPK